jgi:hypothetical protein
MTAEEGPTSVLEMGGAAAPGMSACFSHPLAKADIFDIWAYIAENNETAAGRVGQAICDAYAFLAVGPLRGHTGPVSLHERRMTEAIQRTPWPPDFPDAVVHMSLKARNRHPAYATAKAGDAMAAYAFVTDVLNEENFKRVAALIAGHKPVLAPVAAVEVEGFNAIPDAMAQLLAGHLGPSMADYDLRQSNYVGHTGANGWLRLATPATFT